jgi:hypothetical protein
MLPYAEAMRRDPKGKHPLPDTGVITNTITLSCSNAQTDKCVSDATLRDVLLGLFGPQVRPFCEQDCDHHHEAALAA